MRTPPRSDPTHTPILPHADAPSRLFLGVDGGGTRTRAMVVDAASHTCCQTSGPPTNPYAVGFERAHRNLQRVVEEVRHKANAARVRFEAAFFGLAGMKTEGDRDRLRHLIQSHDWTDSFEVGEDAQGAWAGALAGKPGLVILCGTGSKVYGVTNRGRKVDAGGFGFLLGDEGSGTYIGLEALRGVCRGQQERSAPTCLTPRIFEQLGTSDLSGLLDWVYSPRRSSRDFASLCPVVAAAARDGDALATRIFKQAAERLVALVSAARTAFPEKAVVRVSYQGGVFGAGAVMLKPLRQTLQRRVPNVRLEHPRLSVVSGCVLLAMRGSEMRHLELLLASQSAHSMN